MTRLASILALLLISPTAAVAAESAKGPPAAAKADRISPEGLEFLVGSWRAEAVDPQTGEKLTLAYKVESAVGGAWIAGAGESSDRSFRSRDMWGRDPQTGEVVRMVFDASGAYATFRSPGWKGDTLVMRGDVLSRGGKLPLRQTITRVAPDEFRAVWEAFRNGAWSAYSVERLTRQPA